MGWTAFAERAQVVLDRLEGVADGKGLWYLVSGKTFPQSMADGAKSASSFVIENADLAIAPLMVFAFLAMCGAKKFVNYIYWTVIGYAAIKLIGSALA